MPNDWTHLHRLFKDMKRVAEQHPDWLFMAAENPPRIGWLAFHPDQPIEVRQWTIQLQTVRQQAPFLKRELSQALKTAAGRGHLIELVIGRPGRPGTPPAPPTPPPPPTPTRYELLMQD